ncbi:MAG: flagellar FlbD family protein [Leptospirales bacterium]|nr:flagellar FlbD family protein [Leptospirales bacterium]
MITLHKMNGEKFIINATHIETVEERPDTVITLINDRKYLVKETAAEIVDMIVRYHSKIHVGVRDIKVELVKD